VSKYLVAEPPLPPDDEGPRRRSQPPSGGRSRWRDAIPFILGGVLIALGVVFGVVAYRMVTHRTTFQDSIVSIFVPSPQQVFGKDRIYVVLLGLDYDYTNEDQPFSSHSRTDTIMVAGLDFPTKSMRLISVLRDTGVTIHGRLVKINEAYPDGGEPLSDRVVGDFLGLPMLESGHHFDRYIIVNSNGLKDFINAIGGIDVPVTERMDYDDNWGHLHIHFKPGLVHMNGEQAMGYSRFRHDACSDPCRTKRQQQIIHITMAKLKAEKFNDLLHIGQLISALNKNVKTNLSFDEEKSLAWAFKDANLADLSKSDTVGYVDTRESADGEVLVADDAQKQHLVSELLAPYVNATPPPVAALAGVKPASVHLVIENGSGIAGLAGAAAAKLKKDGYVIDSIGNADAFSYDTTQIRPASKVPFVGERVRKDLGVTDATVAPATDATPGPGSVVTVIVGKDFAQARATAAATPSAAPAH
jgi:LCP family protein required for cell wall assembly